MKPRISCLIIFLVISLLPFVSAAQTSNKETYFQHWQMLGESKSKIDVFYRVINCGTGPNQLHIKIYNESMLDQMAKFDLEIVNVNGKKITRSIEFDTKKATNYVALCESDEMNILKIDLPDEFYAYGLKVNFNFKP
jgi:hypothetical protein